MQLGFIWFQMDGVLCSAWGGSFHKSLFSPVILEINYTWIWGRTKLRVFGRERGKMDVTEILEYHMKKKCKGSCSYMFLSRKENLKLNLGGYFPLTRAFSAVLWFSKSSETRPVVLWDLASSVLLVVMKGYNVNKSWQILARWGEVGGMWSKLQHFHGVFKTMV